MSRTATATEPNEFYDELSQQEQDVFDRIAATGWKPEQAGRGFKATKDDREVGPFPTLLELEEAIAELSTAEDSDVIGAEVVEFELNGDAPGPVEDKPKKHKVARQPILPGTENAVLQDLRSAILGYRATTMDILALQDRQKDEKKLVLALMHKFEDELTTDKETGNKFYQVESVRAILEVTEKEELKTEKVDL